ncbi:MAG: hypothetical protein V1922_04780 [bacterium]
MAAQNYTAIDELVKKYNEMKRGSSTMSKEFDVPSSSQEMSEREISAEQKIKSEEAKKYITPSATTIKLPPDLKKIGLKTDEEEQFAEAMNKIKLPISDERIMEDLAAPPSESRRWFATILLYILERAHLTLKKVGTKVVRIFKIS